MATRGDRLPGRKAQAQRDSVLNTAKAQRERLMAALRRGAVTTVQARRTLDVMHPAQRVLELRAAGLQIVTHWTVEPTECGRLHRCARYVLTGGRA